MSDALANVLLKYGEMGLLAMVLWKTIPALVKALDRNTRVLSRIAGKLGIDDKDSDAELRRVAD